MSNQTEPCHGNRSFSSSDRNAREEEKVLTATSCNFKPQHSPDLPRSCDHRRQQNTSQIPVLDFSRKEIRHFRLSMIDVATELLRDSFLQVLHSQWFKDISVNQNDF
ncbi:hypothetical protein Nepgr_007082 [Nepenthes gracilis]|uniref:Uncharacterized protein n=1 Tax=Nepenthes gracilis TaxID=150966 RepID=A0AAD3S672_NEPGR|nr:hypothetical protein Nepgr_007082 [Nepenthes gracilis]